MDPIRKLLEHEVTIETFIADHLRLAFKKGGIHVTHDSIQAIASYLQEKDIKNKGIVEDSSYIYLPLLVEPNRVEGLSKAIHQNLQQRKEPYPDDFILALSLEDFRADEFSSYDFMQEGNFLNRNIKGFVFKQVFFKKVNLNNSNIKNYRFLIFDHCQIRELSYDFNIAVTIKPKFYHCTIEKVSLSGRGSFDGPESTINYVQSNCEEIKISNVTEINLFIQSELEKANIDFENVTLKFNQSPLRRYVNPSNYSLFLNTFEHLKNLKGLRSQELALDRYINYFRSRDHFLKRALFLFNGGYYRTIVPAFTLLISISSIVLLIDSLKRKFNKDSILFAINPKELLEGILLKDFSFDVAAISWQKIAIALLEVVYIYSLFSFLAAMRRKFGFRKID